METVYVYEAKIVDHANFGTIIWHAFSLNQAALSQDAAYALGQARGEAAPEYRRALEMYLVEHQLQK